MEKMKKTSLTTGTVAYGLTMLASIVLLIGIYSSIVRLNSNGENSDSVSEAIGSAAGSVFGIIILVVLALLVVCVFVYSIVMFIISLKMATSSNLSRKKLIAYNVFSYISVMLMTSLFITIIVNGYRQALAYIVFIILIGLLIASAVLLSIYLSKNKGTSREQEILDLMAALNEKQSTSSEDSSKTN